MNNKNYTKLNYLKSFIKSNCKSGNKDNMFCINDNESDSHRDMKYRICVELVKRGYTFLTEVEFLSGGRADIVAFTKEGNGYIFEVVHSESIGSITKKLDKYPIDFEIIIQDTKLKMEMPI